MRHLFIVILVGFFSAYSLESSAQNEAGKIEKMKAELFNEKNPGQRFELMLLIAHSHIFHDTDFDSAKVYIRLAEKMPGLDYNQQLKLWTEQIYLHEFVNPVKAYQYLDSLKHLVASYPDEIETFHKLKSHQLTGILLGKSGEYRQAKKGFEQGIAIAKKDTSLQLQNALGYTYSLLAEMAFKMNDTIGALAYADSSIITYDNNNSIYISYAYAVKASLCFKSGKYERAIEMSSISEQLNYNPGLPLQLAHTLVCSNYKLGNYQAALELAYEYMDDGMEGWQKDDSKLINEVFWHGHKAAEKVGDAGKRLRLMELQIDFFDEVLNENTEINSLTKYIQKISKEQQAELLKQKDELLRLESEKKKRQQWISVGFLVGFILLLVLTGIIFNRLKLTRQQKKTIELERNKSDGLLLNILPKEVAKELKSTGTAEAKLFDQVTILFADFVGFTKIASQLPPGELLAIINEYFSEFDAIMKRNDVEKIKTIGDSYMAVGGLPNPDANHAINTLKSAIEIMEFVARHKEENMLANKPYFEVRIGVNSGSVVAGIVGTNKFAYDVWGDAVNLASRMERNSEPGKINISHHTFALVKHLFKCTHRGEFQVRGKGKTDMYFVQV